MSREDAIDLLDNLIGMVDDNHDSDYDTALKMAIKALGQEPSGDTVSRKAVLDLAKFDERKGLGSIIHAFDVEQLPSVKPLEKMGHWIRITNGAMKEKYICSKCGRQIEDDGIEGLLPIKYPYCHCGCRMVEPQEGE